MAATSTARWSLIFFGLGLLLTILCSMYLQVHATLFDDLIVRARQYAYGETPASVVQAPVHPLESHHTVEARLLAERLRRDNGKWEKNHPRRRLMEGLRGYEMYRDERMTELKSWRTKFNSLVQRQRNLIDGHIDYTGKLKEVEGLMKKNARIADAIFDHGLQFYGITREELNDFARETNATANHRSGVMYAMKHIVRDWTPEGNHERDPTFPCILDALQQEFPAESRAQTSPRIVVPGAALGRLGHEIAALGDMNVVTNEFSATMNLAWRYLRSFPADTTSTIYPNVDWWSHRATTASMTRGIDFPDNVELLHQPSVELAEGDFVFDLKHYDGAVDAVVTHFFIDTAKNIVSYLEAIHALLKPGGIWINFGPLLYGSNPSIQLSLDEVIAMAEAIGMEIEEPQNPECGVPTWSDGRLRSKTVPYNADSESLSRNAYLAQFWVARKKA